MVNRSISIVFYLLMVFSIAYSQQLPPGFVLEEVATGLNPTTFTFGPLNRIYIADKSGKVWIINEDGKLLDDPLIVIEVDDFDERGLGGITFHPEFEDFPFLYLYYTVKGKNHNRLSRFTVNGDRAIPGSEEVLIDFDLVNGFIHNAGRLKFDSQGYLYVATGDGAEQWNAQSLDNLLGKILRIFPDGSIPADNPFVDRAEGINKAIWSFGFRNPFSMDIHSITDRIYIGDVGLATWEEINEVVPGLNYGWPWIEGFKTDQTAPLLYQEPRFAYHHDQGCAILGVTILDERTNYPSLYDQVIYYTDYCSGDINYLDEHMDHSHEFAKGFELPVDLQVSPEGDLYVLTRKGKGINATEDNTRVNQGKLWRIKYQGDGPPQIAIQPVTPRIPVGNPFELSLTAFGTPPLLYKWHKNDSLISVMLDSKFIVTESQLDDKYYCIVSNEFGEDTSKMIIPEVVTGNSPQSIIIEPLDEYYVAGDTIYFSGFAIDEEDDTIAIKELSWTINFHHNVHFHPSLGPLNGIDVGYFITPTTAETDTQVWYRINLKSTDSDGLSHIVYKDLYPTKHQIKFQGPISIPLNIDGRILPLPGTISTVSGVVRSVQAPISHTVDDTFFVFDKWINPKGSQLLFVQPFHQDAVIQVDYTPYPTGEGAGLLGTYYEGIQDAPQGDGIVRIDPIIDFVWEENPPGISIPSDRFTIVWSGFIEPLVDGAYTINTFTDDGVRLWIGDSLYIDAWKSRRTTQDKTTVLMKQGIKYPIIIQYFEDLSQAVVQLHWSHDVVPSQIIPSSQLYPSDIKVPGNLSIIPFHDDNRNGQRDLGELKLNYGKIILNSSSYNKEVSIGNHTASLWLQPAFYNIEIVEDNYFITMDPAYELNMQQEVNSMDSILLYIPIITTQNGFIQGSVEWAVTPNPVNNDLYFHYQTDQPPSLVLLKFHDLQGRLIDQEELRLKDGFGSIRKDVSSFSAGIYHASILSDGEIFTTRITKF